ncbi:MAG: HAD-IC family P-type ATPase [Myxococcales bacterium]
MARREGWHALDARAVLATLGVTLDGLSTGEAERRLQEIGPNALPERPPTSVLRLFLRQFQSPLIYLLFVAAGIAFALGEHTDAAVIVGVLLLNAVVGAFQEGRAQRSMAALLSLDKLETRVLRDGTERALSSRELVPGDMLLLAAGDAVPADARVVEAVGLEAAEAALTGESVPVAKAEEATPTDVGLGERASMVFSGTTVTAGRARAVVTATGNATEVGRVLLLAEQVADSATPLERRIQALGHGLLYAGLGAFTLVLIAGLWRHLPWSQVLMIAISQLVSVIPEGLPVAMTIALAVGMQRMAARGAVVRRLSAVESLGSTTVICTDKTGTLTRNEMTVTEVWLADGRTLSVSGSGYRPDGGVTHGETKLAARDPLVTRLCEAIVLCNDATLTVTPAGVRALGDPTELALLTFAAKAGIDIDQLRKRVPRSAELPFDSRTKLMATQHGRRIVIKGAPEAILALCGKAALAEAWAPKEARAHAVSMADQALRVLGVAELEDAELGPDGYESLRSKASFLGLVGQVDPPRPEVSPAVETCRRAGIRTLMITGDHKATGLAIARQLGIGTAADAAIDRRQLADLSDEQLLAELPKIAVFARVEPADKLRIVGALQRSAQVVAMTGDGVNDAPALAQADVGVAMGLTGTDVAKQAADIVLTDDNFTTIVSAVEEGRIVFQNIKKVILLLLSTGSAEIFVLLLALVLDFPPPFVAVQILWNNVVTEGTITVNLTMDPASGDEMSRPPIPAHATIVDRAALLRLALMSLSITVVTLGFFAFRLHGGVDFEHTRTATFTLLAVCEWFNVLNCRSETRSALNFDFLRNHWLMGGLVLSNLLQLAVVYLPPLNRTFHTVPLPFSEFLLIGAWGSLVLWVEEARKLWVRRRSRTQRSLASA